MMVVIITHEMRRGEEKKLWLASNDRGQKMGEGRRKSREYVVAALSDEGRGKKARNRK